MLAGGVHVGKLVALVIDGQPCRTVAVPDVEEEPGITRPSINRTYSASGRP